MRPDGRVQVEQILDLGDGRVLTIRGERISMQTIVISEEENP